nr:hypothetical protein [uncultured Sphingosinicella sp.]
MTASRPRLSRATQSALAQVSGSSVVVAAVKTFTLQDAETLGHLGLSIERGRITTVDPAPPSRAGGAFAERNLDGWQLKRKDLPKELREISHSAPSWNGSGSHLVHRTVEAYPLEYHPAKLLTISATILEHLRDAAIVRFRVDEPLRRDAANFAEDLTFNLKLLSEAVGEAQVFDADLNDDAYAKIQHVDWELLPPGSADRVLERLSNKKGVSGERLAVAAHRLRVLDGLNHDGFILGSGRFARYFGARFGSKLVALENLEYGNALYVFEEDWEQLTQCSRTELIKRRDPTVHRVPHIPGWASALRKLLRSR